MPTDIIYFEMEEENKLKIYTDNNKFDLNCYDINDYPNITLDESKEPITISAEILKNIINETSYAVSTQEVRPLLTGVNLKITGDILECIATDSYRLSKKNIKLNSMINNAINIVIPGKSIIELEKMLDNEDDLNIEISNFKLIY